jgi:hypothetical protein
MICGRTVRPKKPVFFSKYKRFLKMRLPVVGLTVETHRIGKLIKIQVAVGIQRMEEFPVKEPGSAGEGGSNCPGGKQHGFPAAFQEVLFYELAETKSRQGNK